MSNNNKHHSLHASAEVAGHHGEYALIRRDLVKILVLNAVYLAAVLALYYNNKQSRFLENWFASVFKF